jgi:hypothetical protein
VSDKIPLSEGNPGSLRRLKLIVSVIAIAALLVRMLIPQIKIDAVSLGFLALALIPWLSPLIKAAELPGGFKIEFQDIQKAAERVTAGEPVAASLAIQVPERTYLAFVESDPRLALVALRIEIEKRLRALAELLDLPKTRPLSQLTRDIRDKKAISAESARGLIELISLGNQAAHGVPIASDAANSAVDFGPQVLRVLDAKLEEMGARASVRVTLERQPDRIVLVNEGPGVARSVKLTLDEPKNPIIDTDAAEKLPAVLEPGQRCPLLIAMSMEHAPPYHGVLEWLDPDGQRQSKEVHIYG